VNAVTDDSMVSSGLLHQLFERQATARPDATALVCGGERMTYRELDRRANQLARHLRNHDVAPGDCVGLLLPRSMEVYVALLGILKAGAAYVPLDPEYPAERVGFILSDCEARMVVTTSALANKATGNVAGATSSAKESRRQDVRALELILLDELWAEIEGLSAEPLDTVDSNNSPSNLAYIIYTSGTTGRPKGVQIEHRSVCHLVRAEGQLFQARPEDRVYQGFSIAFDASVEEVWLAFFTGATLVVGTAEMVHAGAALSGMLTKAGVTVLSCVPTLLAMMEEDVPSLRLLILGGEVCPPDLVKRWWKPNRLVYNTYGPTEATVIATYAECHPGRPVTIGRPLPNYCARILDEQLRPLPDGMAGELCLGGIGLARGYLGRPELTRDKFISVSLDGGTPQRLYRTGDLARWTPEGELEFLGRLDGQVKIRGFRVELSEIESVLMESPDVRTAAVALREDAPGLQQLVAYIVPRDTKPLDLQKLRATLQARMPAYMVPSALETLTSLPTLPSGKVDRKALPAPRRTLESRCDTVLPRTALERQISKTWVDLFAPTRVGIKDDFFLDLGGHSLLAARMVSELRRLPALQQVSMLDVYRHPTIEGLAALYEAPSPRSTVHSPPLERELTQSEVGGQRSEVRGQRSDIRGQRSEIRDQKLAVSFWRHFLCGTAQLISLVFVLSFFALQWLAPYLTYTVLVEEEYDFLTAVLGAFASLVVLYPVMLAVPILVKWLIIGRYKEGAYPLWGPFYFRFWLATTIEAAVPVAYLAGTPLLNIYLRLMGARIGRNVHLASDTFAIYDLLCIGDDSSINVDSNLLGYTVEDGLLKIGRISIGRRCFIGTRAALRENTGMEDDSALEDLSLLPRGIIIPHGQTWQGSPAELRAEVQVCPRVQPGATEAKSPREPLSTDTENGLLSPALSSRGGEGEDPGASRVHGPNVRSGNASGLRRFLFGALHGVGLLIFPVLVVAALFPGIIVMNQLNYLDPYYWYLFLSPLVGVSFIVLLCLEIAAIKWLLLGRIKPGRHRLHSCYYLRKWFVDQTMDLSLDVLGPLYASVYLTPWYKLLGARLGKGAEISTASFISPDLLSIGEDSFIADSVSLGAARVRDGFITVGRNQIGKRSFIGNSAMLPPDTMIGDSVLIGCLSSPPASPADALREDSAWLGSPAIFLPQRQKNAAFGEETTFNPSVRLRVLRATIEFVRVITPSTGFIILLSLLFSALLLLHDEYSLGETLLFFPFLYLGCGAAATAFTIAAKWALVGRYRPGEKPLWSTFVWRNELINALHEHLAEPFLIGALTGTPFVCWYFRLLGARIGRRVYMETTDFSEFDLAEIGDEAALNADCTIQTHLFEDRVMKMSTVCVGPRCHVGAGSLVLYDTRMEPGASLGDLSLLMKGEVLPPGTRWEGIPARKVVEAPGVEPGSLADLPAATTCLARSEFSAGR
jgi:amino acid adenylation domain-containing protein